MFVDLSRGKEVFDSMASAEFSSFADQLLSIYESYNMGMVSEDEMIRYYGVLKRLTPINDMKDTCVGVTKFVTEIVENYDESKIDNVIKNFPVTTILNTLAYIEATEDHLQNAKAVLEKIDTFDTAMKIKIDRVMKTERRNDPVPRWITAQYGAKEACVGVIDQHLDVFKKIFPHITMMTAITDIGNKPAKGDSFSWESTIYYHICSQIYYQVLEEGAESDLDKWVKDVIETTLNK